MRIVAQQGSLEEEDLTLLIAVSDTEGFLYDLGADFRGPTMNIYVLFAHGHGYWENPTIDLPELELQRIEALRVPEVKNAAL